MRTFSSILLLVSLTLALASEPIFFNKVSMNTKIGGNKEAGKALSVEKVVSHQGASWIRLIFGKNTNAPLIRISSMSDGAVQHLNPVTLAQWQYTSAYFNGDSVLVELFDQRGLANEFEIQIEGVFAGHNYPDTIREHRLKDEESLCGPDSRELSEIKRSGRFLGGGGCTGWIIDDKNHCFLTAHHCGTDETGGGVMEFEVPLSRAVVGGHVIVHPPPEHQYSMDPRSLLRAKAPVGIGNDWQYFGCFPNTETGLTPFERQGDSYILSKNLTLPVRNGETQIIGYGVVEFDKPQEWNQAQKISFGPYESTSQDGNKWSMSYTVDTTGGDSGSGVEQDGVAIGVHTHGGCNRLGGGANWGTFIGQADLQAALKLPQGVCA